MSSNSSESEKVQFDEIKGKKLPQKFNYLKDKVAIVKVDDYQPENIKNALKSIFELLEIKDFFNKKSILLKPNALAPSKNAMTPPELITELIKFLKNETNTKEIVVGDSTFTKTITSLTFKRSKIKEKCEELGSKTINFFESERIKIKLDNPPHEIEEYIYLPKEIYDADLIINLPKLKTHEGYVYTGAIKNLFGLLANKMRMHMTHKDKTDFQRMLADIYFAVEETNDKNVPKVFTIMDAVMAMEGKGPRAGKPKKIGLMIAGFNPAAIDIVGYTLMNGNPSDLDVITSLANRTSLIIDINQLKILGIDNYEDFIVKDFKKPKIATVKKDRIPKEGLRSKISEKMTRISIKIKRKNCLLCEECVNHCPAEALERKNDKIIVDRGQCIECFCCGESCPNDAISAKFYLFRILPVILVILAIGTFALIWFLLQLITSFF
ncbi:MAG: DUF362 domain-containing protein [Promethearchaeota archaeon]|nr:MAG: DUF362 domain-containing protein [Candidatus Lokiarchaeota archaeon]